MRISASLALTIVFVGLTSSLALGQEAAQLRGSLADKKQQADSEALSASAGDQGSSDNLRGTLESAVLSSTALRASHAGALSADYGVWRELASFAPAINASLEQSWTDDEFASTDKSDRYAGLQLSMPLFTSGGRLHSLSAARSMARAAHFRTASVRDDVMLQTAEAYMQQVYAVRALGALKRNEANMRRLLTSVRAQHRAGFASGSDVAAVSAELGAVQQQIVDLNVMRQKARDKTNSLAGRTVNVRLAFPSLDHALKAGREALRLSAMKRNPNVLVAQNSADASRAASRAAVSRYLPQVGLSATYRHDLDKGVDVDDGQRWNVGVKLTVPLVDLSTVASIGESKQRAAADRFRAQDAKRQIGDQLVSLWSERLGNIERTELSRQRLADLNKVASSADARFRKGLINLDILLDAQRRLISAEIDASQLSVQVALTEVQILITAGKFSITMLGD